MMMPQHFFMSDQDMMKIWSEEEKVKEKRKEEVGPKSMIEKIVVYMGIVSAIVFVSIVSFLLYNGLKDKIAPPVKISVPAIQGIEVSKARAILEENKLTLYIKEKKRPDENFALDEVIDQEPAEETLVDKKPSDNDYS